MTYLSWASCYEGPSDQAYLELLIPRLMEDLIMQYGERNVTIPPAPSIVLRRSSVQEVASEACKARDAFHIIFIHSDTGGRSLEKNLDNRSTGFCEEMRLQCDFPPIRCITVTPRHEIEAWVLADPVAVLDAFGYSGTAASIGLPADAKEAERLADPKSVIRAAAALIRGRRRPFDLKRLFPAIGQKQSLPVLRQSTSFADFEIRIKAALADLGCVPAGI